MDDLLASTTFWVALGYLLGSIPFGLVVAKVGGAGDIRKIGSGNIGTTNVLRTGRKGLAAATLLLDAGKGALAVLLARWFAADPQVAGLAGAAAFLGHLYPVWLGFKGGKGVATMLGVAVALLPLAGLVFAVVWIGAALGTRYSSLGGMLAAVATPIAAWFLDRIDAAALFAGMAILVLLKHSDNISRLIRGTESKIGAKKDG